MNSFIWQWWRIGWAFGGGELYDGKGRWVGVGRLHFLVNRRAACPVGEPTLYKQVYQEMLHRGHLHEQCVETAADALEGFGNHRATSLSQLRYIISEVE